MRKLIPVEDDALDFINRVINFTNRRKGEANLPEEQTYKGRCKKILGDNEKYVEQYDALFWSNTLEKLEGSHPILSDQARNEFQKLYGYDKKVISDLRHRICMEDGYKNEKCPLCGVNLSNTMDHFIPQTPYPLFVVHPRNLIPSCITCNGHKSDSITDGGKRRFWNSYLDDPPTEQYLYCDVTEENDMPKVSFRLEQGSIDDETFRLIKNTMLPSGQDVFESYKKASEACLVELRNAVAKYMNTHSGSTFTENIRNFREVLASTYILNECKGTVKMALIDSTIFHKCVKDYMKNELKIKINE